MNGNMSSRQGVAVTWSSYNYPTYFHADANGESIGLSYDADRRAYHEQTNGPAGLEQTYDVDSLFDVVATSAATDYRHYVYANGVPVAIVSRKSTGTNSFYYLLSDHQGSVAAITDSTGAVVVGESFAAYGARRNPSSWSGAPSATDLTTIAGITRHGYTFQGALGQQTGLIYMVGRVQDAITGRFLSADPTIPYPTNPQSYNHYTYTENNPLTYADPTGFDEKPAWYNGPWDGKDLENLEFTFTASLVPENTTPATTPATVPWNSGDVDVNGSRDSAAGTESYAGDQVSSGGAHGSTGPAAGSGDEKAGSSPPGSLSQTPQQPTQLNPPLPAVTVSATRLPSAVSTTAYNWFIAPVFGWVDCAGGLCSNGELARGLGMAGFALAGGAIAGDLGPVAGKIVGTGARAVGVGISKNAPKAVALAVMRLMADASVGIMQDVGVPGTEQLEQVLLREKAVEYIYERQPGE